MNATVRTYSTAGLALAAAGVLAVTPVTPPQNLHSTSAGVRLTAGGSALADSLQLDQITPEDLLNIPQNLLVDILNIPYNLIQGVDTYARAGLGYPGVTGTDGPPDSYNAQHPNPDLDGSEGHPASDPIYAPIGVDEDGNYEYVPVGIGGTGSWWMESSGNTWGWDEGNFGQVLGLSNLINPIPQMSTPFAYELQALAMQQIVANPDACPFECPDLLSYIGRWFNVPIDKMLDGVKVGLNFGGDDGTAANPTGDPIEPMGIPIGWADDKVQFDPFFFLTSFFKSLTMDPDTSDNSFQTVIDNYGSLLQNPYEEAIQPFFHIIKDLFDDYFPLLPGSFVYWGAPSLYTVPALLAGIPAALTGTENPFAPYTLEPGGAFALSPYADQPAIGGPLDPGTVDLEGHDPVGPLEGLEGLGAGFLNLAGGFLGYLDPDTYGIEGLGDWHDTVHGAVEQLAGLSDSIAPWYTDLTLGMDDLVG